MKYRKFNKYEKKEVRTEMIQNAISGEGLYLYENRSNADLTLPRPTSSGLRVIKAKAQFQGDNYYMQLVKLGLLKYVKQLQSPEEEKLAESLMNESVQNNIKKEENMSEEKLILDQPDMITEQGKVEHVVNNPVQKLNEQQKDGKQKDVLLNESPSGFVIVSD